MSFYKKIARYYDDIFPVSKNTVDFIKRVSGNTAKDILDIACGTGGYSIELSKSGHHLTGIDMDSKMIEVAKKKNKEHNEKIKFMQGDMIKLTELFEDNQFDSVFCIGNSLVHLENKELIKEFFKKVKQVLKDSGNLIIQVINYDRIISKDLKGLPTIFNDEHNLSFERYYEINEELDKILFKTILTVGDEKLQNQIWLTKLLHDELNQMLKESGFKDISVYGDFSGKPFEKENSYSTIIVAN
jgi:ubiquinone/menaquinone biosynthesis C-methylase UbiE